MVQQRYRIVIGHFRPPQSTGGYSTVCQLAEGRSAAHVTSRSKQVPTVWLLTTGPSVAWRGLGEWRVSWPALVSGASRLLPTATECHSLRAAITDSGYAWQWASTAALQQVLRRCFHSFRGSTGPPKRVGRDGRRQRVQRVLNLGCLWSVSFGSNVLEGDAMHSYVWMTPTSSRPTVLAFMLSPRSHQQPSSQDTSSQPIVHASCIHCN
jgi:hypothetical protein